MPTINKIQNQIERVKQKIVGYQSAEEIKEKRKALQSKYERAIGRLVEVDKYPLERHFSIIYVSDSFVSSESLVLLENILLYVAAIEKILADGRKKLPLSVFEERVSRFSMIITITTHRSFRFSSH